MVKLSTESRAGDGAIAVLAVGLFLVRGRFGRGCPGRATGGGQPALRGGAGFSGSRDPRGRTKLAVQAVARNDRDGSLSLEDGRGRAISGAGLKLEDAIMRQSSWLDLADIVLGPDTSRFDVIELRIFEHPTRRLLANLAGKVVGFEMVSPSVVQLRRPGHPSVRGRSTSGFALAFMPGRGHREARRRCGELGTAGRGPAFDPGNPRREEQDLAGLTAPASSIRGSRGILPAAGPTARARRSSTGRASGRRADTRSMRSRNRGGSSFRPSRTSLISGRLIRRR